MMIYDVFSLAEVTSGAYTLDPEIVFHTDCTVIHKYYTEAFQVKKKQLWKRLKEIIHNALEWCRENLKKLWNGLIRFRNKKVVSPNTICAELKLATKGPSMAPAPSDSSNDAASSLYADFLQGIDNGDLIISPYHLMTADPSTIQVKGNDINGGSARIAMVLGLLYDSRPMDEFIRVFTEMTKVGTTKSVTMNEIQNLYEMCKSFSGRPSMISYAHDTLSRRIGKEYAMVRIPMKKFVEFQLKLDEMTRAASNFDAVWNELNIQMPPGMENDMNLVSEIMNVLNELSWNCVNLQGGLHAILNQLSGIYYIAPQYTGSIHDPATLAKFVKKCLQYGMPNKFLVNNIYRICDYSMKGDVDSDHPNMGFGRMTLIPPKGNSVYKIAINEYGIRSNKNDFTVMNIIQGTNVAQYFAMTTNQYEGYVINQMEKVAAGSKNQPSMMKAMSLANTINNELKNMGSGIAIADIKPDAFGKKNGQFVIYDYGYIHRTDVSAHRF